eukprot:GHVN01017776.1.p1 GENE.GHVN01017776.1~~GHVN01017776.1.p1  ORF type:complete len:405 (+),score=55.12 GHVN01017776.1:426-1640(+)
MRGAKALVCETSMLHPTYGILFRGHSLDELLAVLPKASGSSIPMTEGLIWLLLTGQLATEKQANNVANEIRQRMFLPAHATEVLEAMPVGTHPMTQLVIASAACQTESLFSKKYKEGISKNEYWKPCLDDAMSLIAKVPIIAARIYRRCFKDYKYYDPRTDLDWAGNFAHMMGYGDNQEVMEMMRLYMLIHADHEGGNVSAHTAHLVGSALADPYLSYAASMAGLAGPLHGLANQECLEWLLDLQDQLGGDEPTVDNVTELAVKTLESGRVIPGYGHAVLRITDPRFLAQRNFALQHMPDDPLFKLLDVCYQTIPNVLKGTGKVSNPFPNVDAHSGVILSHYGITESNYFTVLFGVARSIGVMCQTVWSRIYQLPIERPGSVTLDKLDELVREANKAKEEKNSP